MRTLSLLAVLGLVVTAGCSSQKDPAQAALKTAQDAYAAVSAEAQKYVPDQASAIQNSLTAAQDAFNKGDYAAVLTQAQAIPAQVTALTGAIAAKKTELQATWNTMSAGIPNLVTALKSRVETLSKSHSLPAGITKDTLAAVQTGLADATQNWSAATAAATSGDLQTATTKAKDVMTRVVDLMKSLNMQVPAGAGGLGR